MHPILRTVLEHLALGLLTLFVVSIIIFSSLQFLPGDFATAVLGQAATPETVAAFRNELGLNEPLPVQCVPRACMNATSCTQALALLNSSRSMIRDPPAASVKSFLAT